VPRTLIANASIFDGTGGAAFPGEVLIEGNRITAVAKGGEHIDAPDAERIDGGGATLIPGLVEAHGHLGFGSSVDRVTTRRDLSSQERLLFTAHAVRVLLDFGFTSLYSAGSADAKCEVALRDAIEAGWMSGCRISACSFERSASAFVPSLAQAQTRYAGISTRAPDVAGTREFVNDMADLGVDSVKFVVTGESGVVPGTSRVLQFYDEELQAAGEVARERGVWLNGHVHSCESIKMALRHGFRVLYHCTWADEEAMDLLEAQKDRIFIAPAPGINWANCYEGEAFGITREVAEAQEQFITLEQVQKVMPELHKRGLRILPGGDYGFAHNPIGRNGRDLELFVKLFGFTPAEALSAATKWGGEIMGREDLGLIRAGFIADLLLVEGDVLADLRLIQARENFRLIMQNGRVHKYAPNRGQHAGRAAA